MRGFIMIYGLFSVHNRSYVMERLLCKGSGTVDFSCVAPSRMYRGSLGKLHLRLRREIYI